MALCCAQWQWEWYFILGLCMPYYTVWRSIYTYLEAWDWDRWHPPIGEVYVSIGDVGWLVCYGLLGTFGSLSDLCQIPCLRSLLTMVNALFIAECFLTLAVSLLPTSYLDISWSLWSIGSYELDVGLSRLSRFPLRMQESRSK